MLYRRGNMFGDGFGGISSINVGPDGYLYVISLTKVRVYKIIPFQCIDQLDISRQR